jgi:uncharacterized membrane protein YqiK
MKGNYPMLDSIINLAIIGLIGVSILAIVGVVIARCYKRASKQYAFVRTGMGGQKVVKDGGALIIPIMHDTLEVNMQTIKLEVHRSGQDALLTRDKMRVDVEATFYTKVKPDEASIAMAAQTLGKATMDERLLKQLVENKFVDTLRSVAADMVMADLNEKRAEFAAAVKRNSEHDLMQNGLELETVSVTKLDQTDIKFLNANNVFDAEGLANITKITQAKAKERNEIEQDNRIAIEQRNLEANQKSLAIKQQNEFATFDQQREVETRRAEQEALLAKQRAERKRESEVAAIEAEQETEVARITAAQKQQEANITSSQLVKLAEQASNQEIKLAEQIAQIAINEKSEAESKARASADAARAEAVKAAELVRTAEAIAVAERAKQVAIIQASQEAERKATEITIQAKAEHDAAELRTAARMKTADAQERELTVQAEGERKIAEAKNSMSAEQIKLQIQLAAIAAAPKLVEQLVKPMAAVKNARVISITGMGQNGAIATPGQSTGNVPKDLADSLLNYRLQAPFVDAITNAAGFNLRDGLENIIPAETFGFDDSQDDTDQEITATESKVLPDGSADLSDTEAEALIMANNALKERDELRKNWLEARAYKGPKKK